MCLVGLLIPGDTNAKGGSYWVRGVVRAAKFVPGKDARETFQLQVIRSDNDVLTGLAVLTREISKDHARHAPIDVQGVEREGRFWPDLRAEISGDLDQGWHEVVLPKPIGERTIRHIAADTLGEALFINLGAFRPHIGREHYGRLLLPNGEAATFYLDNLRPPEKVPETWTRGGMGAREEIHPTAYEATFLVPAKEQERKTLCLISVEGETGRVTGSFSYVSLTGRLPTIEEQVDDYKEPTWPPATLQVAHDYNKIWTTIATASNPSEMVDLKGPPEVALRLQIGLDAFRPMIGKFRYGKVVLRTGDSTVIELRDLLPPERELNAKEHPDWQR